MQLAPYAHENYIERECMLVDTTTMYDWMHNKRK